MAVLVEPRSISNAVVVKNHDSESFDSIYKLVILYLLKQFAFDSVSMLLRVSELLEYNLSTSYIRSLSLFLIFFFFSVINLST